MKKVFTTLLGLSLVFGTVACGSDDNGIDLNKAKIEAQKKAEALKKEAIKKLTEAKDLASLNSVFEALPKDLKTDTDVLKAMSDKKAELEKLAKEEAEKKAKEEAEQKAKEEAKQKAIKSLTEAKDLASLNSLFDALSEDLKADADVLKAKEDKKTELEKKAKEEAEQKAKEEAKQKAIKSLTEAKDLATLNSLFDALSDELKADADVLKAKNDKKTELEKQKALTWLEGKTFVSTTSTDGMNMVLTLIFKENFTFISKNQMGTGDDLMDMTAPIEGTYKYLKPTLTLTYQVQGDIYGGGMKDVSEEYQVDEEQKTITADIQGEIVVFKLQEK